MATTIFTIRDETKKGSELQVSVADHTFAYGLEITVSADDKPVGALMLDYFDGKLTVRQWDEDKDEYVAALQVLNLGDGATEGETSNAL